MKTIWPSSSLVCPVTIVKGFDRFLPFLPPFLPSLSLFHAEIGQDFSEGRRRRNVKRETGTGTRKLDVNAAPVPLGEPFVSLSEKSPSRPQLTCLASTARRMGFHRRPGDVSFRTARFGTAELSVTRVILPGNRKVRVGQTTTCPPTRRWCPSGSKDW